MQRLAERVRQAPTRAMARRDEPARLLVHDAAGIADAGHDVAVRLPPGERAATAGAALTADMAVVTALALRGFHEARARGLLTVGLAGHDTGRMAEADTIDHLFVIPSMSVHRIQEAQTTVFDVLWELSQEALEELGATA